MKIGDKVIISAKNPNHLGYGVSAYAGMEGIVSDIWEDNSFTLKCETSTLVVPMKSHFKHKKGIWIWLNGELVFHKRKAQLNYSILKNCFFGRYLNAIAQL